ncbi:type II 3-dehydroquinate dehydratase [Kitasatospora sp. GP82]|uniref:type II 3-dehydroquinate dehydratase n=1 Tax=Kitasatospora sp. GP82 TaxID=3035089 RepID=UPI002474CF94|nr:type II 3-dehydroquinate dehydratase [Kitasatospora sp. GP82]MDH6124067.1 3-dehydroquinate dehydratase-2 [Kitasatospora sp. GP82]
MRLVDPVPPLHVLLLNGPNLNLLGERDPARYGTATLHDVERQVVELGRRLSVYVDCVQSNSEGELITLVHQARLDYAGIVINPGAYAHYSYALRDALEAVSIPVIEVHISNIHAREPFRATSVTAPVVAGSILGCGTAGYELALRAVVGRIRAEQTHQEAWTQHRPAAEVLPASPDELRPAACRRAHPYW